MEDPTNPNLFFHFEPIEISGFIHNPDPERVCIVCRDASKWRSAFIAYDRKPDPGVMRSALLWGREILTRLMHASSISDVVNILTYAFESAMEMRSRKKDDALRFNTTMLRVARDNDLALAPFRRSSEIPWLAKAYAVREHRHFIEIAKDMGALANSPLRSNCAAFFSTVMFSRYSDFTADFARAFWLSAVDDNRYTRSAMVSTNNSIFAAISERASREDPTFVAPAAKRSDFFKRRSINCRTAWWVTSEEHGSPSFEQWKSEFRQWFDSLNLSSLRSLISSTRLWITYLSQKHPELHDPGRVKAEHVSSFFSPDFLDWLNDNNAAAISAERAIYTLNSFYKWRHDNIGLPDGIRLPNPFEGVPADYFSGGQEKLVRSVLDAMPPPLVDLLKTILVEDDFAFARSVKICNPRVFDPETGEFANVFCPALPVLFYTYLNLPLRKIQGRLLDSGEADDIRYDASTEDWVTNSHPLRCPGRYRGVIRRFTGHLGTESFAGFYINSNKNSYDILKVKDPGYEIPWNNKDLINHLDRVRTWQERYNPIHTLKARDELTCRVLRVDAKVAGLTKYAYLFRDAISGSQNEPFGNQRIYRFWCYLLQEGQERLAQQGTHVKLVDTASYAKGFNLKAVFPPHSMRVTGITNMVLADLPLDIVQQFITGHATRLMLVYYVKRTPLSVNQLIEEAVAKRDSIEEDTAFIDQMLSAARDESAFAKIALGGSDARASIQGYESGHWSFLADGICPVGGAKCDQGGEILGYQGDVPIYAAITRSPFTCALCRFRVTGPAFLPGLIITMNNLLFVASEQARGLMQLKEQEDSLIERGASNKVLKRKRDEILIATESQTLLLRCIQARGIEIHKCRDLLAASGGDTQRDVKLLTHEQESDLRVSMEEAGSMDLVHFVSEASEVFPHLSAPSAKLRRLRLIDQMLVRNGYPAFTLSLTEEEATRAAKQFMQVVTSLIQGQNINKIFGDDGVTLESLGIYTDLAEVVPDILADAKKINAVSSESGAAIEGRATCNCDYEECKCSGPSI